MPCAAGERTVNPAETQKVLTLLLSASNELIPSPSKSEPTVTGFEWWGTSCEGDYGQEGPARLKDLLSMQLAGLYQGKNNIKGKIRGNGNTKQCSLEITHAAGEVVYSFELRFLARRGKILMNTLRCVSTP